MGKALYRKYRSRSLDEIVGQSHITTILASAIKHGNIAHAYLLTGPRGVGKTSIARILAHEINGLSYSDQPHLDIIEIDAASNNSVEDVRDLREKVQIAPVSALRKIYIIDEVHMLSKSAFNALLKTLEEPPEHAVFILATTDVDKLPATIISRVQQFNFRTVSTQDVVRHLGSIAKEEGITIDEDALELIAIQGEGSVRDSLSILDQLASANNKTITKEDVERSLGLTSAEAIKTLLRAYEEGDIPTIVQTITTLEDGGSNITTLAKQMIGHVKAHAISNPALIPLLDGLIDATVSNWPGIKLMSTLSKPAISANATVIQNAPKSPSSTAAKPLVVAKPAEVKSKAKEPSPAKPKDTPTVTPAVMSPRTDVSEFPWHDFLATLKVDSIGATTLLSKCGYEYDGITLTIYAGKAFNKKQIDKSLQLLQKALQAIGIENAEVAILAEPKPASDSKTAAVLAMMGGGEEVTL